MQAGPEAKVRPDALEDQPLRQQYAAYKAQSYRNRGPSPVIIPTPTTPAGSTNGSDVGSDQVPIATLFSPALVRVSAHVTRSRRQDGRCFELHRCLPVWPSMSRCSSCRMPLRPIPARIAAHHVGYQAVHPCQKPGELACAGIQFHCCAALGANAGLASSGWTQDD